MKKLFGIMALVAIAATAGWNFIQSQNQVELSELALANVEALANGESSGGSVGVCCNNDNNYKCKMTCGCGEDYNTGLSGKPSGLTGGNCRKCGKSWHDC